MKEKNIVILLGLFVCFILALSMANADLTDNLENYYFCNDTNDFFGNNNFLTNTTTGQDSNSLNPYSCFMPQYVYNVVDTWLEYPYYNNGIFHSNYNISSQYFINFWIYLYETPSENGYYLITNENKTNQLNIFLKLNQNLSLTYMIETTDNKYYYTTDFNLNLSEWYMLSIAYAGSDAVFSYFINSNNFYSKFINSNSCSGNLCDLNDGSYYFIYAPTNNMLIDEIGLWKSNIQDSLNVDINLLYNNGTGFFYPFIFPIIPPQNITQNQSQIPSDISSSINNFGYMILFIFCMIGFIANYKYKIARLQLLLLIFFVGLATQFKTDFIMNWFCLLMAVFSMLMWFSYIQNENLKKKKELY